MAPPSPWVPSSLISPADKCAVFPVLSHFMHFYVLTSRHMITPSEGHQGDMAHKHVLRNSTRMRMQKLLSAACTVKGRDRDDSDEMMASTWHSFFLALTLPYPPRVPRVNPTQGREFTRSLFTFHIETHVQSQLLHIVVFTMLPRVNGNWLNPTTCFVVFVPRF